MFDNGTKSDTHNERLTCFQENGCLIMAQSLAITLVGAGVGFGDGALVGFCIVCGYALYYADAMCMSQATSHVL